MQTNADFETCDWFDISKGQKEKKPFVFDYSWFLSLSDSKEAVTLLDEWWTETKSLIQKKSIYKKFVNIACSSYLSILN